jgi:myo-inositol-1(or 4)-monophosphatase
MKPDRSFFQELSRVARRAISNASVCGSEVYNKARLGFDPVTRTDREVEEALRRAIQERFPKDAILGEEFGTDSTDADRTWLIDPIDGTRAFICGLPNWSVLVGVTEGNRHVAGMIDIPATSELFVAVDGKTMRNDVSVQTSGQAELSNARLSTTDPFLFVGAEFEAFDRARNSTLVTRYGLDGFAYARIAAGDLDLVIESGLQPWDFAALIPVVRGAGGHIGDWAGGGDFGSGRIIAAASESLYAQAVEIMRKAL